MDYKVVFAKLFEDAPDLETSKFISEIIDTTAVITSVMSREEYYKKYPPIKLRYFDTHSEGTSKSSLNIIVSDERRTRARSLVLNYVYQDSETTFENVTEFLDVSLLEFIDLYKESRGEPPDWVNKPPSNMVLVSIIQRAVKEKVTDITIANKAGNVHVGFEKVGDAYIIQKGIEIDVGMFEEIRIICSASNPPANVFSDIVDAGREFFTVENKLIAKTRINIAPIVGGHTITIRILPHEIISLDNLNADPDFLGFLRERFVHDVRPGLKLICGPTASGKNTIATAVLEELIESGNYKVSSVEMPVEIKMDKYPTFYQHEARDSTEYTKLTHALLRQNPSLVYITEIRDAVAEPILQVANTGKSVLSTLHTNDIPTTLERAAFLFKTSVKEVATKMNSIVIASITRDEEGRPKPMCSYVTVSDEDKKAFLSMEEDDIKLYLLNKKRGVTLYEK